jgi:hypothetical protein
VETDLHVETESGVRFRKRTARRIKQEHFGVNARNGNR